MVCDAACFLISNKVLQQILRQMIYRASTINIQHAPRAKPQLTCAGPHNTANGVLGWVVSIKAGGVSFYWLQSRRRTHRQTDRHTLLLRFALLGFKELYQQQLNYSRSRSLHKWATVQQLQNVANKFHSQCVPMHDQCAAGLQYGSKPIANNIIRLLFLAACKNCSYNTVTGWIAVLCFT